MTYQTHIGVAFASDTHEVFVPRRPLVLYAKGVLERQLWAQRIFSNPAVAAAMLYAYLRDSRYLSADEIAELAEVSPDTVRRVLKPLVATERVMEEKEDRVCRYRLAERWAQQGIEK